MVNGATIFSKLDIMKAFHQLELDERSRGLTTITTHVGLFRYKRLHMGISCASEVFTETIRVMLAGIPCQLNMTDDILVYGRTREEHQRNLMAVLKRLEENGLTLSLEKCQFYRDQLTFFGLRFSASGVSPTEDRRKAIIEATEPLDAKELKSFLCSMQFSARFIDNFCTLTEPLMRLTRAGVIWKWGEVEQAAFEAIKNAVSTKSLAYFNCKWQTEVVVDASPVGVCAVLRQINPKQPDDVRVVCFASRMLSDIERRYSQCEREALACVWGCERFWVYLFGTRFLLVTDNRAVTLIFANTASRPPARIERMALRLSQYDFEIVHRDGLSNVADYFSRHPSKSSGSYAAFLEEVSTQCYINFIVSCNMPRALTVEEVVVATTRASDMDHVISRHQGEAVATQSERVQERRSRAQHVQRTRAAQSGHRHS